MTARDLRSLAREGAAAVKRAQASPDFQAYLAEIKTDPKFIEMCAEVHRRLGE